MTPNYPQLIADEVAELPVTRQAEIYDFAQFVRKRNGTRPARKAKRARSVFKLFGSATSKVVDASVNHDKYLYEE